MTRNKTGLVFLVGWPTFWYVLVSRFVFDGTPVSPGVIAGAKATYAVAFGMFGALTVVLNGFVGSFTVDLQQGRYRKFRSMPIVPAAELLGRFLAGFVLALVSYCAVIVIGVVDGGSFALRMPLSLVIVLGSLFAFCTIGIVVALFVSVLAPRPEHGVSIATALLFVAFFATGFNGVDTQLFPGPAWLANWFPNTLATRIQLYHLVTAPGIEQRDLPRSPGHVGLLLVYALVSVLGGVGTLDRLVYGGEFGE